ncbi:MAG: FAD-dependent oxidoreductase [Gammaproteobacteria bacterium]|nr:FAD-dependent oxidoreductase [Gammaproteobacteria bacterium]
MASIAVIGAGISGLTAAYYLSRRHDVTLFEENNYLGGHTDTHEIVVGGAEISVDTGFIVFNDRTYPHFILLLTDLGCAFAPTEMSFSVKHSSMDLEYNGHNLNTLFCQRRNLIRPSFLVMVSDILRFNRAAQMLSENEKRSLGDYLVEERYSESFQNNYLLPMAAAIWSTGSEPVKQFPILMLARFFIHHGLVDLKNRPQWQIVTGGSNNYIRQLKKHLGTVHLSLKVTQVSRNADHVTVVGEDYSSDFDQVVIATHSDQALTLLSDPTKQETSILGDITYTSNHVKLHTDTSVMPKRRLAWASWNYNLDSNTSRASLTYYVNRLQHLTCAESVFVTLNDDNGIEDEKVIKELCYRHPYYDHRALAAQARCCEISGQGGTHYAGAYWGNGFHEDGVMSALRVCKNLGVETC